MSIIKIGTKLSLLVNNEDVDLNKVLNSNLFMNVD